jgi:CHAD domain-containing protein
MEYIELQPIENRNLILLIKKTYHKTAKLYNDARSSLDTEIIHKWRRFNKHLLFQLKLSPFRTNNNTSKMISSLEELSDILGAEHDLAIMEDYLKDNFNLSKEDQQQIHLIVSKERSRLQKTAFAIGAKLFT